MSCQISANQREAETSANGTNFEKQAPRVMTPGITNVISTDQYFASTFSMIKKDCITDFLE